MQINNSEKNKVGNIKINKRLITLLFLIISLIFGGVAIFLALTITNQNVNPEDTAATDPCGGCSAGEYCDSVTCSFPFCCPVGISCRRENICPNEIGGNNNNTNNFNSCGPDGSCPSGSYCDTTSCTNPPLAFCCPNGQACSCPIFQGRNDDNQNDPCGGCPSNHYCDSITCPGTSFCCPNGTSCTTDQYREMYCPNAIGCRTEVLSVACGAEAGCLSPYLGRATTRRICNDGTTRIYNDDVCVFHQACRGSNSNNDPCGGCPDNYYCDTTTCPGIAFCCQNGTNCTCPNNSTTPTDNPNNTTPTNNPNNTTPTNNPNNTTPTNNPNNTTPTNNPNNTTPTNNPNNTTPTNNPNNTTPINNPNNSNSRSEMPNNNVSTTNINSSTSNNSSNRNTPTQITTLPAAGIDGLTQLIWLLSIGIVSLVTLYVLIYKKINFNLLMDKILKNVNNLFEPKIKKTFTIKKRKN